MIKSTLILSAAVILLPLSCSSRPRRVVIGIALTSSNHSAVELAVKEINEGGGIAGIPVALEGLDWKVATDFGAKEIIEWANRFAQTKDLVAVIGHSDSSSTLSAAAVYNRQQIPQIVTIATNPAITNIGDWTYRMCLSDSIQGVALARYAVKEWGKKSICVFYVNDAYGKGLAEVFETEVRRLGGSILSSRMHRNVLGEDDEEMVKSSITHLRKGDPDLFVLFDRSAAADRIIRAIRRAGFHTDILGGDNLGTPAFIRSNSEMKEGMRVSQFFSPSVNDDLAMRFVSSFREYSGSDPDYGQAFAYDAVYLVRDAILKHGSSREGVKNYLDYMITEKRVMNGVGGAYTLGTDHDARRTMYIAEGRKGQYERVKPLSIEQ
jgi:branched-chain amino acid transport system substrate-binding protein